MRVLVTGATGFTGGHLAATLARRGYSVRALVRDVAGAQPLRTLGIELAAGDLADAASIDRAVRDVDLVYHIAAIYRQAGLAEERYRAINATAVRSVIESARRHRVRRVVHCSTVGVHGDVAHPPANEDAPLKPGDVYQRTKLEGESVARQASAETGVEVV
ncbi:MAG TPA: NAD-dependent epimerase/dehydratase family protein, partial [Vicinamibacterales bacterium]|nr:NAD-dependent epimerase/dehydratase family protein [Vicinamibacterales bacterium]